MFAIFNIGKKLFEKLQRKAYRHAYVAEHVRRGIAYQIRALRDQRDWNQGQFAKLLGKPQSVASRLEDPGYGKVTVQTLLQVAAVYDVALQVRFVPYSTFLQQTRDVSTQALKVPSFNEEASLKGTKLEIRPTDEILLTGRVPQFDLAIKDDAEAIKIPETKSNHQTPAVILQ